MVSFTPFRKLEDKGRLPVLGCASLMCYLLCVMNAVAIGLSLSLSENRISFFVLIVVVEQRAVQHVVTGATQPKMEMNAAFGVRIETAAHSNL